MIADFHLGREKPVINPWDVILLYCFWDTKKVVVGEGIKERIKKVVEITKNYSIDFVVVLGDVTELGIEWQFREASEILKVPCAILQGCHDVVERKLIWKSNELVTFSKFKKYFKEQFEGIKSIVKNWKEESILANFTFTFEDILFIAVDNVSREKCFFQPGVMPWQKIHRESKQWLYQNFSSARERTVILLSHIPIKIKVIQSLLEQNTNVKEIVNIAGHYHKFEKKEIHIYDRKIIMISSPALWLSPLVLVVKVTEGIELKKIDL